MLSDLTSDERSLVERCVRTVVLGPFIKDAAFKPIIGISREDALRIVANWSTIDDSNEFGQEAILINNCLNAIRGPGGPLQFDVGEWREWIGAPSRQDVRSLFEKYRNPSDT
jgi:hypothetical protein